MTTANNRTGMLADCHRTLVLMAAVLCVPGTGCDESALRGGSPPDRGSATADLDASVSPFDGQRVEATATDGTTTAADGAPRDAKRPDGAPRDAKRPDGAPRDAKRSDGPSVVKPPDAAVNCQMYVSPNGNDSSNGLTSTAAKKTIKAAVSAVTAGGLVCIASGTYQEQGISINKALTLQGAASATTIVGANGSGSVISIGQGGSGSTVRNLTLNGGDYCVSISASNVRIENNNLTKVGLVGILGNGDLSDLVISGNTITGTSTTVGNGISFEGGVKGATVTGNTITTFLHGILFNKGNVGNTVSQNKVTGTAQQGAGIYSVDGSQDMKITGNTVTGYEDGIAVQQLGSGVSTKFTISDNVMTQNKNGLWVRLNDSLFSNNTATYSKVSGLDISGTNNQITGNTSSFNAVCGLAMGGAGAADNNTVTKNVFNNNDAGVNSASPHSAFTYNKLADNKSYGIISTADYTTITNNTITNSGTPVLATGSNNTINNNGP